jgi:hypothetical protein
MQFNRRINRMVSTSAAWSGSAGRRKENVANKVNDLKTTPLRKRAARLRRLLTSP